jgi:hypothetical protein
MKPTPHDGLVLVGQEPHGQDPQEAVPHGALQRDHLLVAGLDVPLHAEEPGHREPPDVGVEHADGQPPAGEGHGQVDGDRALADAALARRDGDDAGGVGDGGDRRVLTRPQARPLHHEPLLAGVHDAGGHGDVLDPGQGTDMDLDVPLDLGPQGAAGHGQGDPDVDPAVRHPHRGHHAQVDDVRAEFGVHHVAQGVPDGVLGGCAPVGVGCVAPGHCRNCSGGRCPTHRSGVPEGARAGYDRWRRPARLADRGAWHHDPDRAASPSCDHEEQR